MTCLLLFCLCILDFGAGDADPSPLEDPSFLLIFSFVESILDKAGGGGGGGGPPIGGGGGPPSPLLLSSDVSVVVEGGEVYCCDNACSACSALSSALLNFPSNSLIFLSYSTLLFVLTDGGEEAYDDEEDDAICFSNDNT